NEEGDRYTWKVIRVEYEWSHLIVLNVNALGMILIHALNVLSQEKEKGQVPKEKGSAKDNDTGNPFHVDEVVSSKNSCANHIEEDSGLDEGLNVSSHVNADGNDKGMKDGTTFTSLEDDDSDDDEEVYMPNDMHGGGFMDDLEDDLNCYEDYGTQVYDLKPQEQAFCDQYDIRLNSHGRK
nr:hypothetical protein [Tanacetum cinerariifolium]